MPIKLFQDGQVLDAADVNTYFMDQALVVFDDVTDRTNAFGGSGEPELKEGRISFLKSDKTLYIYLDEVPGTELPGWTPQLANIEDGSITSAKIFDGTIVNADISPSADIALSKLAIGSLPTDITISSGNIVNGTIMDADINSSAAIALTKLGVGALPTGITIVSANIVNGTIVNDDINSSAEIAQSKISGLSTSLAAKLDATATAVDSEKIGGRTVFVQQGTPTALAVGDIWFQVTGIAPL
jgi:hypothetical protein